MLQFQYVAKNGIGATFLTPNRAEILNFRKIGQIHAAKPRHIHLKVEETPNSRR
jgi:hypothetical protein